MKNIRLIFVFILFISSSKAANFLGGDITYEFVDKTTNTYKIRLTLYASCSGIPINSNQILVINYSNFIGCTNAPTSIALKQISIGDVSPLCGGATTCSVSGALLKGMKKYIYETTVVLPTSCGIATFSLTECCKSINAGPGSITTVTSGSCASIYFESKINLGIVNGNNSSKSIANPYQFFLNGQKNHYDQSAIDADGDSLVYSWTNPYCDFNNTMTYNTAKPFNMAEASFYINPNTGEVSFTPTSLATTSVAFKTKEYRKVKKSNGGDSIVFAGETNRDIILNFYGGGYNHDFLGIIPDSMTNATYVNSKNIAACKNILSFKFKAVGNGGTPTSEFKAMCHNLPTGANFSYYVVKGPNNEDTLYGKVTYAAYNSLNKKEYIIPEVYYCTNGARIGSRYLLTMDLDNTITTKVVNMSYCIGGVQPSASINKSHSNTWYGSNEYTFNSDSSKIFFHPTTNQTYFQYIVPTGSTCGYVIQYHITVVPMISYVVSPSNRNQSINFGGSLPISMSSAGFNTYNWSPKKELYDAVSFNPSSTSASIIARPKDSTKYYVTIVSDKGCSIMDSMNIRVNKIYIKPLIYFDLNKNGIKDPNETYCNTGNLKINYGSDSMIFSNFSGDGSAFLPVGFLGLLNFSFTTTGNNYSIIYNKTSHISSAWSEVVDLEIALQQNQNISNCSIVHQSSSSIAKNNIPQTYTIIAGNSGNTSYTNTFVSFVKNPKHVIISSNPAYTSIIGDSIIWLMDTLKVGQSKVFKLVLKLDTPALNANPITTHSYIIPNSFDTFKYDNDFLLKQNQTGVEKICSKSEAHEGVLFDFQARRRDWLYYTIRFSNNTNVPLEYVKVLDTIQNQFLDLNSIEMVYAANIYTMENKSSNIVEWNFSNFNAGDDTTYFIFRIRPKAGLLPPTTILNKASISMNSDAYINTNNISTTIQETEEAPIIQQIQITTDEDVNKNFCNVVNDPDANFTLYYSIFKNPNHGKIIGNIGLCLTYEPNKNYNGKDTIYYKVCDQTGLCDSIKIPIVVLPIEDTPTIVQTPVICFKDSNYIICPNISDPDSFNTLTLSICNPPVNGQINSLSPTCYLYKPNAAYLGDDSVCIQVCDNTGRCAKSIVLIHVVTPPIAPIITSNTFNCLEDATTNFAIQIIDPDLFDVQTITIVNNAKNGNGTINNKTLVYTPNANYVGADSILLKVCDSWNLCTQKTILINVQEVPDAPVILDSNIIVYMNHALTFCPTVIDVDAQDTFGISIAIRSKKGVESVIGKCIKYAPSSNYTGNDEMIIAATDRYGVKTTKTIKIAVLTAVDINNQSAIETYTLFPNPFKNQFSITFERKNKDAIIFNLMDNNGKIVQSKISNSPELNVTISFDTEHLSNGIYSIGIVEKGQWKVIGKVEKVK